MQLRAAALLAALATTGCGNLLVDPMEQLRDSNKRNLVQLSAGMTRDRVEQIMGNESAGGGRAGDVLFGRLQTLKVTNPARVERIAGSDGIEYDVLFYYTDLKERDDKITDDELTPVVFRDGKLVGTGYAYLAERAPKYSPYR